MERKLVENDLGFEKAEICMKLFNRCSITELLIVEQMQRSGELKTRAKEHQKNQRIEKDIEPSEQHDEIKRTSQSNVRIRILKH